MKILNLYCGIGGNRKLWGNSHDITSVEYNPDIAKIYQDNFPNDKIVVGDAHEYLLNHHKEFDFIWSSPPCPTHSDIRRCGVCAGQYEAEYPEMELYQEIILLKHFAPTKTKWVIENVKPYYKPLIPGTLLERHLFWSNFYIPPIKFENNRRYGDIIATSTVYGFNIKGEKVEDKRKVLRNMVDPRLGKYLLEVSQNEYKQVGMF